MMSFGELLIGPVFDLIGKFVPDKDKARQLAHDIATLAENHAHEEIVKQLEVNKQEAAHSSIFVAGWRPFIGWSCGIGINFNWVVAPLINWGAKMFGYEVEVPVLDMAIMMPIVLGMLGLAWGRTKEKIEGVAREK